MVLAISDLVLALVVAGATAIGAAIGGAITGAVTLKAEDKRQAFTRELEQRRFEEETAARVAELRVAVRLVQGELIRVGSWFRSALRIGVSPVHLPHESWDEHRGALARTLSTEAWTAVSRAYGGLEILRPRLEEGDVDAEDPSFTGLLETIDAARDALVPYVAGASIPVEVEMPPGPGTDQSAEQPPKEP